MSVLTTREGPYGPWRHQELRTKDLEPSLIRSIFPTLSSQEFSGSARLRETRSNPKGDLSWPNCSKFFVDNSEQYFGSSFFLKNPEEFGIFRIFVFTESRFLWGNFFGILSWPNSAKFLGDNSEQYFGSSFRLKNGEEFRFLRMFVFWQTRFLWDHFFANFCKNWRNWSYNVSKSSYNSLAYLCVNVYGNFQIFYDNGFDARFFFAKTRFGGVFCDFLPNRSLNHFLAKIDFLMDQLWSDHLSLVWSSVR